MFLDESNNILVTYSNFSYLCSISDFFYYDDYINNTRYIT